MSVGAGRSLSLRQANSSAKPTSCVITIIPLHSLPARTHSISVGGSIALYALASSPTELGGKSKVHVPSCASIKRKSYTSRPAIILSFLLKQVFAKAKDPKYFGLPQWTGQTFTGTSKILMQVQYTYSRWIGACGIVCFVYKNCAAWPVLLLPQYCLYYFAC